MLTVKYVDSLDDWEDIKMLAKRMESEGWTKRVGYSLFQLQHFFLQALTDQRFNGIVLVKDEYGFPVHATFLRALVGEGENCRPELQTHIVASYSISKGIQEVYGLKEALRWTDAAWKLIQKWAKDRGHRQKNGILANVREGASFKALEKRYKLKRLHVVVGADVDYSTEEVT